MITILDSKGHLKAFGETRGVFSHSNGSDFTSIKIAVRTCRRHASSMPKHTLRHALVCASSELCLAFVGLGFKEKASMHLLPHPVPFLCCAPLCVHWYVNV